MNSLRMLIVGCLAMVGVGQAQSLVVTNSGWLTVESLDALAVPGEGLEETSALAGEMEALGATDGPGIAEAVTPDIQALADGLQHDPVRIFNYVHDQIRYVVYFGSKKGAQLTLLERSGNDFDQCALLMALLRAAGYTNQAGYQFGWMLVPYDNPDGSHQDLRHWLRLSMTNNNWTATGDGLDFLFRGKGGYPLLARNLDQNTLGLQRVWVTLVVDNTTNYLDPAFKVSEPIPGLDLPWALGFSNGASLSNALFTAAQGLETNNYVTNVLEAAVRNVLSNSAVTLRDYLESNCPNASVEEVLSGHYIVPSTNRALSPSLRFPTTNLNGTMPVVNWSNQPTNMMSTLGISFANVKTQWFMPQLKGQRLSLTVNAGGSAQLWLEDTNVKTAATGGGSGTFGLTMTAYHPGIKSGWDTTNNVFQPGSYPPHVTTVAYQKSSATYALVYAFEPDWGWLRQRQRQLAAYRQRGLADSSRQVLTETLNVMGLNWQLQVDTLGRLLGAQVGVLPHSYHRIGRMSQESGWGYYVDVYMAIDASSSSVQPAESSEYMRWVELFAYFASAMEHGMIEQLQATNLVAASTVKLLQLANTNHQAVYLANTSNWTSVQAKLTGYSAAALAAMGDCISQGYSVLLPRSGTNSIDGAGSWTGYGYLARWGGAAMGMYIGDGQHSGGFVSDLNATVSPSFVAQSAYTQPRFYTPATAFAPRITGADPVNLADGAFEVQEADLAVGGREPRGLHLSRYYSSSRRHSNPAGLAPGWLHNYYFNAATTTAAEAGLGGTTPAQMAPMLAATCAAAAFYRGDPPSARNWLLTALIAKWGVDQLTRNAVSVSLGKDTVQFIRQPDGSFTAPANCTLSLLRTNGVYWLRERHGNTFRFDAGGRLTNLVDQYQQSLSVAYLSSTSNLPRVVTDWQGRSLTFNYLNGVLTNVTDSAGRKVFYGYASTNLTRVGDPEGKTNTFLYDTNHQIVASKDALGQLVVSNVYDGFGRVTTQYTQGDANKMWRLYWSEGQTVEQDPAGGQRVFYYDDKSRLIGQRDALGNLSQTVYDGQDQVVMSVSPLNETNRFLYDGNHNLTATIDPLGYSNQFFYDSQDNLVRSVDARGGVSTFGYNAQFSLTGATNGAGDWTTHAYNTDGTLYSRGDSGGATTYTYDGYGQLDGISHPDGLGSESFGNSALGDVTNHVNARGFATSFQYNSRRQLTNTVGPTNLTAKVAYNAIGDPQSVTDARGFTTSSFWSPTRHPTGTVFPATPQGTPASTNLYDSRDWLRQSIQNPASGISAATSFTNDAAARLLSVTDPLLRTTRFGYDADSRRTNTTNAAQETTGQQWNGRGQMTVLTDPSTHTVQYDFDAAGNQITLTNRRGKGWQFQFDAANRLTNTLSPAGRQTRQAYNDRGLVQTATSPGRNVTVFSYDARGRATNVTDAAGSRLYNFDGNNNLTSVVEGSRSNVWTFDAYDRASSYRDADGNLLQYRYDANGNLTNLVYPGGRNVSYAYDSLNRLTNVTDWASRQTSITYDLFNRVMSITRPNVTVRLINYDAAGQTTNIVEKTLSNYPIAFFTLGWTNSGRIAWEFAAPLPPTNPPPCRAMTYDDDNRIVTCNGQSVVHDDDGNMTSGPVTNSALATYAYDARNRLSAIGSVQYGYDPAGNRTSVTNGGSVVRYVVNPNAALPQVLIRTKPDNSQTFYVYGPGLLYEVNFSSGGSELNTRTYHFDYRGSTVALTDSTGLPTDQVAYSPYGLTIYRTGTNDTPFLYNGRYGVMTEANGLLYMRARYYNPYLCRFINADPSGFGGGLNTYLYADGNPVSMIDPFGLCPSDFNTGHSWLDNALDRTARIGEGALGLGANAAMLAARGTWAGLKVMDSALKQSGGAEGNPLPLLMLLGTRGLGGAVRAETMAADSGLIGLTSGESSALARQIYGIEVNGQPAVSSIEAFGSRAGSTFRGRGPLPTSDLDIIVTLNESAANPAGLAHVNAQLSEIGTMFQGAKGFPVNPVVEIPGLPSVKPNLLQTPFIPLKP